MTVSPDVDVQQRVFNEINMNHVWQQTSNETQLGYLHSKGASGLQLRLPYCTLGGKGQDLAGHIATRSPGPMTKVPYLRIILSVCGSRTVAQNIGRLFRCNHFVPQAYPTCFVRTRKKRDLRELRPYAVASSMRSTQPAWRDRTDEHRPLYAASNSPRTESLCFCFARFVGDSAKNMRNEAEAEAEAEHLILVHPRGGQDSYPYVWGRNGAPGGPALFAFQWTKSTHIAAMPRLLGLV